MASRTVRFFDVEMDTYSINKTPPGEIIFHLPHKYHMELNRRDMMFLYYTLAEVEWSGIVDPKLEEWAGNFRRSILETIGIGEV